MAKEKKSLLQFTLKLSKDERTQLKLLCAADYEIDFQYQIFDAAILWALENKETLIAIANPKHGSNKSYYICERELYIERLETCWDCNATRAVHTAIVHYLKHRQRLAKITSIAEIVKPKNSS
ncbi:MAG: hypothetical protein JKY67_19160 [Pseudomonadales bacterium]|nr:hypothetical protein [Pseudomonadales bacterium]